MLTALVGIFGTILGIFINEYFHRKHRIENYSQHFFDKRLKVYEGLIRNIDNASKEINSLIDEKILSQEDKVQIAYETGLTILKYADKFQLYLNEEIIVHIGATFVNPKEIFEMEDGIEKDELIEYFNDSVKKAKEMIKNESGIGLIEKLFKTMIKT